MAAASTQSFEGGAVAQSAGMPRVVDRVAAGERAGVLGDDPAVLADHDAVHISIDSTGRPTALAATEYLLLSKRARQVLETDAGKPSNRPA